MKKLNPPHRYLAGMFINYNEQFGFDKIPFHLYEQTLNETAEDERGMLHRFHEFLQEQGLATYMPYDELEQLIETYYFNKYESNTNI